MSLLSEIEKGMVILKKPEAVVCDIEGTTTSVRFWEECLGPVVWLNTRECLKVEWDTPETKDVLVMIRKQMHRSRRKLRHIYELPDRKAPPDIWILEIFKYFKFCVEHGKFTEDIIALQVLVSYYCYKNKICQGHVYEDAKNAFKRWRDNGILVGVYSSGVTTVQRMIFAFSSHGNIHNLVSEYFSAIIDGSKTNSMSYLRIARHINRSPSTIVYVSDSQKECAAAYDAGFFPVLMIRSHNSDLLNKPHRIPYKFIQTFDQLRFVAPAPVKSRSNSA